MKMSKEINLKITFEKPQSKRELLYSNILPGVIYEVWGGIVMLKLKYNESVILIHPASSHVLRLGLDNTTGLKGKPAVRLLGTLSGISVKKLG